MRVFKSSIINALLCFWYLTVIVGLDIHYDYHDGEVFVVSLLAGIDCKSLHPDDVCHCIDHHGHCDAADEDCENEICLISLTGDGSDMHIDLNPPGHYVIPAGAEFDQTLIASRFDFTYISDSPPRQLSKNSCVLRI